MNIYEDKTSCCLCGENICWGFLTDHLLKDHKICSDSKEQNLVCCDANCNETLEPLNYRMFKKHILVKHCSQKPIKRKMYVFFLKFSNTFLVKIFELPLNYLKQRKIKIFNQV